ncbi:MAG: amino acid adenylation domain-containing protein [Clostridia bacterium]|nr:amino acid adenylation domain-containing protein [Clostridia bacterium]
MKDIYELTNPQKSIWLIEEYYKGTNINNVCGRANIEEKINFELLQQAINIVIKNNSSFLINFKLIDGDLIQYKTDYNYFDIQIEHVKSIDDVLLLEKNLLSRVFDIENSYLFEFRIFQFPDSTGGFILNIHHLLADSWTLGLTCKQIIDEYNNLINGKESEVKYFDYFDFCTSEKDYLNSEKFRKDKEYWESQFETIPEMATLPSFKTSGHENTCKAARVNFEFAENFVEKINSFCKNNKISIFNFLVSIYSLYIGRICNLDDFVIGTPILNRANFAEKNTTGMFISTVPLRIKIENEILFKDFATSNTLNSMQMLRHQKYPYEFLQKKLREKESNLHNLYNILISYQITKAITNGLNYSTNWAFNGNCSDDLQIHILDINDTGKLNISYDYKLDKYEDQDIANFHYRIEYIINQILENNEIKLKDIEIVTPKEKDEILNIFNNTVTSYPKDKTIVDLFEDQVKKTPNKTALVFENKKLTYSQLNKKANQLANYLIYQGVQKGDTIGILVNRSLEMIIGLIAILKTGSNYLPIDPDYPQNRIEYMINDSNTKTILVNNRTQNINIKISNKINIELESNIYNADMSGNLNLDISPESLMYIIYTSGSTGKPKGVMLTHRNINNFLHGIKEKIDFSPEKNMISVTTISFDIFGLECWGALTNGLKLILANEQEQLSIKDLKKLCENHHVDMIQTTPSRYLALLESTDGLEIFTTFSDIMIGGEPLPQSLLEKLHNCTKANIFNLYGPTETTIWSTLKDLTNCFNVTIGKPISNTTCYILDKNTNLLPPYVAGTIYIGGDGVSKGYLNKIDLTNERFIKSRFKNNETLYNTGDLAYYTDQGELVHLGREDFQVKIRGYRIELTEIENMISNYKGINNCIATAINDNKKICAYYISDKDINLEDLNNYLINSLPNYMIPNYFIRLKKFPYTPNGKIDRKSLSKIDISSMIQKRVSPKTTIEKDIYNIICEIINDNNFGITDDFFSIGLDSLNAIKLTSILQNKYNIEINSSQIYKLFNIKELSQFILKNYNNKTKSIIKKTNLKYYPLSSAQKRIYYASKMSSKPLLYNISGGLLVRKILDENKIKNIFKKLINIHSSFKTCFKIIDNEPKQIILDNVSVDIKTYKKENIEPKDIIDSFPKEFDFEKAPLVRVEIDYLDNEKTLILIDSHHLILDGTSLNILIREFCDLYNNSEIEFEKIEYKDYTIWENDLLKSDKLKVIEKNWLDAFNKKEIPIINLPYDYALPQQKTFNGNTITMKLDKEIFEKISILSKHYKISSNIFFLSVFYILLYKYTGQDRIIIGTPMSGRFNHDLENTIGMFVNNIPLTKQINPNISFLDFVNEVKNKIINTLADGIYPYDMFTKALNLSSTSSLFDVMFIYQSESTHLPKIENHKIKIIPATTKTAKYNLSMEIIPSTRRLNIEYNADLFEENTINDIMKHYLFVLNNLMNNIDTKISSVQILSEEEKNNILYNFNNTKMNYNDSLTITQLIERQVLKTPNKTALVFKDQEITYEELNKKSNALAAYLRTIGIKQNTIVGILINRSMEMIICMLGILKAGGTYLPIDPTYPKDRISYIINDSKINVILTKEHLKYLVDNSINLINVDINSCDIYDKYPNDNLSVINTPEDTAYLIYTSGSTGKPKGVLLTHKNVNNFIQATTSKIDFKGTIVSLTTFCFDIFVLESLLPLQHGLTIVIADEDEQNIPKLLNKICKTNNVTMLQTTPSRMNLLLSDSSFTHLKNIKTIMLGGEAFPQNLLNNLKKLTTANIYNMYGPTETTVWSTIKNLTNTNLITIGKPVGNTSVYVLDEKLQPVPIGCEGRLFISGDGVSKGYYNRPELTKTKFINNPFITGTLMYDTGDLVKWNKYGELVYSGRSDFQVKIRGLRIELGEIENKILEFPEITKAIVCKKADKFNRQFLCGYFVSKTRISISELKNHLNNFLPNYMIPNFLVQVQDFTYTPNGKIDRNALPEITFETSTSDISLPKTKTEKLISSIYEKLLCISPIGIDDNFFDIGGDSILALKLQIELLNKNINISYSDIFVYNTIRKLANKIDNMTISSTQNDSYSKYDYTKINSLLKNNNEINMKNINNNNVNGVLLTGSTGFLGAHILANLLENTDIKIYCLVRKDPSTSVSEKLLYKLHFYFGNQYDNLLNKRFFAIESKLDQNGLGISKELEAIIANDISHVINSAANVKHFGSYDLFKKTNVDIVIGLKDFCLRYNKKLIQISTTSVSGNSFFDLGNQKDYFKENKYFAENILYFGQPLDNLYIKSKFEAERIILENIVDNKLDALILRVGNITNRFSDGKFQYNYSENAFANRLKVFLEFNCIPNYLRSNYIEFTPVDFLADAIVRSIKFVNKDISILHLYNQNHLYLEKLVEFLDDHGLKFVDDNYFTSLIESKINNPKNVSSISFILNDLDKNNKLIYESKIKITNALSQQFLDTIGFKWPQIIKDYILKLINNI